MIEIPLLLVTGFVILFILNNAKARDIARAHSKWETQRRKMLFLDDSISLKSMRIKRFNGKLGFYRSYSFEYNEGDFNRYNGKIELIGYKVTNIQYFHTDHIEQSNLNDT